VKTPLTTNVVSSSGLREIGSLTTLQDELAHVIESQASYLADLTDKLLRTAKLEDRDVLVQPRTADFAELYQGALAELHSAYDTSRIVLTGSTAGTMHTDPDLFRMVLVQLLENALKYSPDSSRVNVNVDLSSAALGLSVHNLGSYIPAEEQKLVFERYYRSAAMQHRAPGTGVGLSVAKHAIEAQNGRIWMDSDKDHGTTFHIALPLTGEEHAPGLRADR
jgi:two-component system sensor histidine kinase KdpD